MKKIFKELFKSPQPVPRTQQYGVVLITTDPEKQSTTYQEELRAMMRYPHIVKTHHISVEEAKMAVPQLTLSAQPTIIIIREGIDSSLPLRSRLQDSVYISNKPTKVLLFIDMLRDTTE